MERDTVRFYRDDTTANKALADFISANPVIDARKVTFSDDDYIHRFVFIGMEERRYWDGWMCGIKVTTENGDEIIFASWDNSNDCDEVYGDDLLSSEEGCTFERPGYDYDSAFKMFVRSLMFN